MQSNTVLKKKIGEVVATGSERTATVLVERIKQHPLYHKKYTVGQKFLCENPENKFKVGDQVEIVPCRPLSKRKHYEISRKIND
jgi:small subunit ribosomal protein S17